MRVGEKPAKVDNWTGARCWCGRPAKFEDHGRPKCGNHALGHRAEKERWRKVIKDLQTHFTTEEARECVRLAIASKLASQDLAA